MSAKTIVYKNTLLFLLCAVMTLTSARNAVVSIFIIAHMTRLRRRRYPRDQSRILVGMRNTAPIIDLRTYVTAQS